MPRISTDNYDTVASWNGSQDLFVVEQPDGTKVATPAMVKQFIEAGDFTATGEITDGHGNILAGKQDTLTFDNVPTENSDNPVKSGGTKTYVDNAVSELNDEIATKVKKLPLQSTGYTCKSTDFEYTNISVTCPTGHTYIVRARLSFFNTPPLAIVASMSNTEMNAYQRFSYSDSSYTTFMLMEGQTAYIWGKWRVVGANTVAIDVIDIIN